MIFFFWLFTRTTWIARLLPSTVREDSVLHPPEFYWHHIQNLSDFHHNALGKYLYKVV